MDAFASVTACLSNAGASIGGVQSGFSHVPVSTKLILIVAMLAGRLEVMTLIIVCTPTYWRV
jgi:trk system potassium uptake protein TrkH